MSAHVLLNLLNELMGKTDEMLGFVEHLTGVFLRLVR